MSNRVTKTPQAGRDLLELADTIAQDNLDAAERFLDAAEAAFHLLAGMPEMGTRCQFRDPEAVGISMWTIHRFENYVVFYRPLNGGIDVVRVIHASRDIQALFDDVV